MFFLPDAIDGYVLPRVALLFTGAAVGLALWLLAPRAGAGLGPLLAPAAAVAVVALAALALSASTWASLAGQYLRYESAPVRIAYLLLFAAAAGLAAGGGEPARRRVVDGYLAGCAAVAVEAAYEAAAARLGLPGGLARPDGNLGNAALLGALEAMAAPLALDRLLRVRRARWAGGLGLVLVGLLLSAERSAWVAALGAVLAVGLLRVPARRRPAAGVLAAAALLAGVLVVLGPLGALNADPFTTRLELWRRVLPMLAARPWLGWGEDTFGLAFPAYAHGYLAGVVFDRAHSQPLDLAAAQGLAGLAAGAWLGAAYVAALVRGGRWRREENPALLAALGAYLGWSLVNFDWAPATACFFLLAAVAWAAGAEPAGPAPRRRPWLALPGIAAAALAAVAFGLLPLAADLAAYAGNPALATGLDPIQAHYWQLRGESLPARAAGRLDYLRRAAALGDDDASLFSELGQEELAAGHGAAARAAFERAREIDPALRVPGA